MSKVRFPAIFQAQESLKPDIFLGTNAIPLVTRENYNLFVEHIRNRLFDTQERFPAMVKNDR
jgi:hypothetical protein